jgi:argininosuccinate synthase
LTHNTDVGQEEDWELVKKKANQIGATKMIIEDLQKEFVDELCFRGKRHVYLGWKWHTVTAPLKSI